MSGNNSIPGDDWVRLNVGGKVFETTKETLSKYPDSFLSRLVNGGLPSTQDKYGAYRIDRSYEHFDTILNYFRNCTLNFERNEKAVKDLLCEANFYNIQPLVDEIHKTIKLCPKRTEMVILTELAHSIAMKKDNYGGQGHSNEGSLMQIELVLRDYGFEEKHNYHTQQSQGGHYYYTWKFVRTVSK